MIPAATECPELPLPIAHVRSDHTDRERRGLAIGTSVRARIHTAVTGYDDLFTTVGVEPADLREHGETALAQIEGWAPGLHRELIAVAAGAEVPPWRIGMLNARTEILATVGATAEGECSTAVYVGGPGAPHTIQTWDWHREFTASRTLVRLRSARGAPTVSTFTEAGILAKIGVNSGGLGVHFNILSHRADGTGIKVPVHAVARRVLEEATTIAEARDIAASATVSASTVLTVVTYDGGEGDAACIELSPAGTAVVRPDPDGVLLHTNHFLDPTLAKGDQAARQASTHPRLAHLSAHRELLMSCDRAHWTDLLRSHDVDGAPICCHPQPDLPSHQQWSTLLTVSLDLAASSLRYHDGGPCTAGTSTWQHF
ncbi:C45 family peptidase [Streptomyces sp. NPDC005953]|uniref:C45 family peptidase n=1 Tax=Streptomyces sp. NPDC005953 TaxID=3156719 RepID=UPI0033F74AC1